LSRPRGGYAGAVVNRGGDAPAIYKGGKMRIWCLIFLTIFILSCDRPDYRQQAEVAKFPCELPQCSEKDFDIIKRFLSSEFKKLELLANE